MLGSLKRFAIVFILTFCISALLFGVAAMILVPNVVGMLDFISGSAANDDSQLVSGFVEAPDEVEVSVTGFSALFVGTDYQPDVTPGAKVSTDSMIFVTVSEPKKSFVYVSLPSNMEVSVGDKLMTLGQVYDEKGIEYLCEKVTGLTGLSVNYHAVVSLGSMEDIVDKLGGVEFSVPVNMEYQDPTQGLIIDIDKGRQVLNGADAVKMLRYRSDSFDDKMARNLSFFQTLVDSYAAADQKANASELYVKLAPYITTNFGQNELVKYLDLIWSYDEYSEVILDYPGEYQTSKDVTVFVPDTVKALEMLSEYKNS